VLGLKFSINVATLRGFEKFNSENIVNAVLRGVSSKV
jgi:hypothetical protein